MNSARRVEFEGLYEMDSLVGRCVVVGLALVLVGCSMPKVAQHQPGAVHATPSTGPSPVPSPPLEASPSPVTSAAIQDFVPIAEAFVEAHRGLKFKAPVTVTLLEDNAFTARLLSKNKSDKGELEKETKVLRALGLIQGALDLGKAEDALLGGSVVGYYDPKTKELVVRGAEVTPAVRLTLVHELTHALQDQYFNLDGVKVRDDDESGVTTKSVIEGDAVRIERAYYASLTQTDQAAVRREQQASGGIPPEVPRVLVEILAFPYQIGPLFDEAVVRRDGQDGLDKAFATYPTTSSQLLHPEKYFSGDGPHPVDAPPAGGTLIDHGVVGEMGLLLILEALQKSGSLSSAETRAATAGWGGDQYVAWDEGSQTCVRTRFVMDSPGDTDSLLNALGKLAASRSGVTLEGTGPVTLTSCG